jgi:hypothetical protein
MMRRLDGRMTETGAASHKKERVEGEGEAGAKGRMDMLTQIVDDARGSHHALGVVTNLRDLTFEQYLGVATRSLEAEPDPRKNSALTYLLAQELSFRALFKDSHKFASVLTWYSIDSLMGMAIELQHDSYNGTTSFATDHIKAGNALQSCYENYRTVVEMLAGLAAVANGDARWKNIRSEIYLKKAFEGRYAVLLPDKEERRARNALAHREIIKTKGGKFILLDIKDKKGTWSSKHLDEQIISLTGRTIWAIQGFTLPAAVRYELVRTAMHNGPTNK